MNGMKPKFIDHKDQQYYYEKPNPYVNPTLNHVNLPELSRYAKRTGKKLVDITKEELEQFVI